MGKIIRLTESQLIDYIKTVILEGQSEIDSILDKISRVGFDDLSNKEKSELNDSGSQNKEEISVI